MADAKALFPGENRDCEQKVQQGAAVKRGWGSRRRCGMKDPVDEALGWMLDTFGPWSPAILMVLVAVLLVVMGLTLGPAKKTPAEMAAEVEELARLGFDGAGNPLPDGPYGHLVGKGATTRSAGSDSDSDGGYGGGGDLVGDESDSGEELSKAEANAQLRAAITALAEGYSDDEEEEAETVGEGLRHRGGGGGSE